MSKFQEILKEIANKKNHAQDEVRRRYALKLSRILNRDVIIYATNFTDESRNIPSKPLSVELNDVHGLMSTLKGLSSNKLALVLHSPGGSMEAAEQMVNYLRQKYSDIIAIVPQNAFSAATMIACACNEIYLGKHSALGPIDPQVAFPSQGQYFTAPAHAVIDEFNTAREQIQQDPRNINFWGPKIQQYPIGFLSLCEMTVQKSESIVASWLEQYMFSGQPGSDRKAKEIASWLASRREHKTHSTPIMIDSALNKGLIVKRLEDDPALQGAVLNLFHAVVATFRVTQCIKMIENQKGIGSYTIAHPPTA